MAKAKKSEAEVEDMFAQQLRELNLKGYRRQYPFLEGRRFKADFAFLKLRLLFEVDGGVYGVGKWCPRCRTSGPGGHTSGVGYTRDRGRDRLAYLAGWQTIRFTTQDVRDGLAKAEVPEIIARRKAELGLEA